MAVTSTMLPLGTEAPDFGLPDAVSGEIVSLASFAPAKALVVMFICNHCPYVKHVADQLVALVAISANDPVAYPDDAPEKLAAEAQQRDYRFPYLFDATQEVAKAYTAACTPDFFVFGPDRTLVYRGRLDESRPGTSVPVTGAELRAAIEAVRNDHPVAEEQYPSMGCNIKWRPGNEPAYFQ